MTREEVYKVIDSERDYQNRKWNPSTTTSNGRHSWEEWYMYIEDYVSEAKHLLSRLPKQDADAKAAEIMRKVAAMAVSSMEQLGAPPRPSEAPLNPYQP